MDELHLKYEKLKELLRSYGSAAVAFSGGVDSTLLLRAAHDVLGEKAAAVTAVSCSFPKRERSEAENFCERNGIRQLTVEFDALQVPGFRENPKNRCYLCKHRLFDGIIRIAEENDLAVVCEGSNMDDLGDYRPGLQAIKEMNVASPLRQAGLYKEEIRALSRELGLPTAEKPSYACLASRFVYGEEITKEKLNMVEQAEELLRSLGFVQFRVRIHGTLARIEVLPEELEKLLAHRTAVYSRLKELGFSYVTMDLLGYRTGSMNETIDTSSGTNK